VSYALDLDPDLEPRPRCLVLEDYVGASPRWCPGCGDHSVLGALQRLARDEQLLPEQTVVVSGIGCSSRFPHYMKTYGFHGLHGRPLPVACGIRSRRPDLHLFVVTGDGDCCAIGTAHWIHAVRYNMKMTVMLLDNQIYGLTKAQSSPTSRLGQRSNTHPLGTTLPPLNPLTVTLGITNASFVAQTVDWSPPHLYATLREGHHHPGLAFVRVIQRCPHYMEGAWDGVQQDPAKALLLTHPHGVPVEPALARMFPSRVDHDPSDLNAAREHAAREDVLPLGLLYRRTEAPRYDETTTQGLGLARADRIQAVQAEVDRFLI
jgi:2-oxoglutarate ferredoxin oxidoreductase subunit beta